MASQGPRISDNVDIPSANDLSWTSPDSVKGEDSDFAHIESNNTFTDTLVGLAVEGVVLENQAKFAEIAPPDPAEYWQYVFDIENMETPLTPAEVNGATFGIIIQWTRDSDSSLTDEIYPNAFGFTIPLDAAITTILVELLIGPSDGGNLYPGIDNVRITVNYTEAGGGGFQAALARGSNVLIMPTLQG